MAKHVDRIPLSSIAKIALVLGKDSSGKGRLAHQVKADTGADYVINFGFYNGRTGKPTHHMKIDNKVMAQEIWNCWGFAWDTGPDIAMVNVPQTAKRNHIAGTELISPMTKEIGLQYKKDGELGGIRGRTAAALTKTDLITYCCNDGKDAVTLDRLQSELLAMGAESAVYGDGGGSSQGAGPGWQVDSSDSPKRKVYSYLCIWLKKDVKEEPKVDENGKLGYMTKSDCYNAGRTITPKGIMVHSSAIPNVMARELYNKWNVPNLITCTNGIVDDKEIIQCLPWNHRSWHAGTGTSGKSANDTHISFEMCEHQECRLLPIEWIALNNGSSGWAVTRLQMELKNRAFYTGNIDGSFGPATEAALKKCQSALGLTPDGSCGPATLKKLSNRIGSHLAYNSANTAKYFESVWNNAVSLCATLCKQYGFDPMKDIICHSEGYKAGIATNHADVTHWFPEHGKTMDDFRAEVKVVMKPTEDYRGEVKARFGFDDETVDYLAVYKYGSDLLRKLATQG